MSWIIFASVAYLMMAMVNILDKVLLSRHIPRASIYAAYVGIFGFYAWLLAPFGFSFDFSAHAAILSVSSGFIFILALFFFYKSIEVNEISRTAALVGAMTSVFLWMLGAMFGIEILSNQHLLAFFLLVCGGLLITIRLSDLNMSFWVIILGITSSFFFALSWILIKVAYNETSFLNAYILGRNGELLAGLFLLAMPGIKRHVSVHIREVGRGAVALFAGNKILAASAFVVLNYAAFLGSVTLVQGMQSLQYVFVLLIAGAISWKLPWIFQEEMSVAAWSQKMISILIIGAGFLLLVI